MKDKVPLMEGIVVIVTNVILLVIMYYAIFSLTV